MSELRYSVVTMGDRKAITLFHDGQMYVADSDHRAWDEIWRQVVVEGDLTSDPAALFDPAEKVVNTFKRVSDRVTVAGGVVYFDGDAVHSSLTDQIVRFLDEGVEEEKWASLVNFMEKVAQNPSENSREQLYEFLSRNEFTILADGNILGYKKVHRDEEDDSLFRSVTAGRALVNDEVKVGRIPQRVGDYVTMPRSEVDDNAGSTCSTGLHVANWNYANSFSYVNEPILKVSVNPRDVVSVPNDSSFQKVRVCKYQVLGVADAPVTAPVEWWADEDESEDYVEDDYWGDGEDYAYPWN